MIKEKLAILPTNPGCYLMLNDIGDVIYVGKAKNLKARIKSYFSGAHNAKTEKLISEIRDFNYIITNSEQESLLLEYNLIKKYAPIYNIRLIDDKSYPYIEITNEKDPMLVVSRYIHVDHSKTLFGPYPNVKSAKETVKLLQKLYPLRRCNPVGKKPCMYYQIGLCLGPCTGHEVDYKPHIEAITRFLNGDTKVVLKDLETRMKDASSNLEFEKALEYRNMIKAVSETTEKQIVSLNDFKNRDFVAFYNNDDELAIHILMMREGRILDTHQKIFAYFDNPVESALSYLVQYYEKFLLPDEINLDSKFKDEDLSLYFKKRSFIPMRGDKKKLVDLALKNAKEDLEHYHKLYQSRHDKLMEQLNELKDVVGSSVRYIEVFDNAHLFGTAPISGSIVWKDHKFERKMYRKYHLKTTEKDDYQAMYEVVYRRLLHLMNENAPLPDLVCVDGGLGQVNKALAVMNDLRLNVKVLGLKKNKYHELEGYVYNDKSVILDKKSALYHFLANLSNEVHRYTTTFYKKTKNRKDYSSVLDYIPGLGKTRKKRLITAFDSIDKIKAASVDELREVGLPDKVIKALKEGL